MAPLAPRDINRIGASTLRRKAYPGAVHEMENETNAEKGLDDVVEDVREVVSAR